MQQVLLVLLILGSIQAPSEPALTVQIDVQPQPLSFLGFYDSVFPLHFTVLVTNIGRENLPAGNLTLRIDPPSKDRYSSWDVVAVPELSPGASFQSTRTFRPIEPGLHTFQVYSYTWAGGQIGQDQIRYNYTIVDFRGPEIVYGSAAAIVVAIITLSVTVYLRIWKPRWKKYRCRGLPHERIFRGKEYGYDPKTFLEDARSVDLAFTRLRTWYADGSKPLLLKGVTGLGKSRLVTEFLGSLSIWGRLWRRVMMPTPHEMSERFPPFFAGGCILFLNDLHEFKDSVPDSKLRFYVEDRRFKVVATITTEKYESSWAVLSSFIWDEVSVEAWTSEEGMKLAEAKKVKFESGTFKGTPLSVLAPDAELKRSYELLSAAEKAVLQALKIIKIHLGCFADYDLVSAIREPGCEFEYSDFLDVIFKRGFWCKTYDSMCLLADGVEDFIPHQVSMQDAYRLQVILEGEQ